MDIKIIHRGTSRYNWHSSSKMLQSLRPQGIHSVGTWLEAWPSYHLSRRAFTVFLSLQV